MPVHLIWGMTQDTDITEEQSIYEPRTDPLELLPNTDPIELRPSIIVEEEE